ncbi:hypothetical protein GTY65_02190 [Streptomyces sp. SID8379]|uniref:hypothetical protein n=1 Tax=unclassified Streptomyces TaxID=2593676 RepID=UPI0003672D8A|nr:MULTISPECIES: hypothetical protein [unclassified Streptomyces]MYW62895.1 hypothetical protein [Streptomyces sp. SID8379]
MSATKRSPSHAEQALTAAGRRLRERRPAFDVAAGLHRLARDAGYTSVPDTRPSVSRALHSLQEFVGWSVDQPGAVTHVEQLAATLGGSGASYQLLKLDRETEEVDLDGAHVFACMLYLAGHPESAQFWWRLTAMAGVSASALCLQLLHQGRGETEEAEHWRDILLDLLELDDDPVVGRIFVNAVGAFAAYTRRHRPPAPVTPVLDAEVRRLATRADADLLVCRPDAGLARRLQDCAHS